jgi:hypothetical protein
VPVMREPSQAPSHHSYTASPLSHSSYGHGNVPNHTPAYEPPHRDAFFSPVPATHFLPWAGPVHFTSARGTPASDRGTPNRNHRLHSPDDCSDIHASEPEDEPHSQAPSHAIPLHSATQTAPPFTPPGFDHQRADIPAADEYSDEEEDEARSHNPKGPIRQDIKDLFETSFTIMDNELVKLSKKSGRSVEVILNRYKARYASRQSTINAWNLYQKKFSQDRQNQWKLAGSDAATCEYFIPHVVWHSLTFW